MIFALSAAKNAKSAKIEGGEMTEQEANLICDKIRQVAYDLHVYLGVGYLESDETGTWYVDKLWLGEISVQEGRESSITLCDLCVLCG